MGFRSTFITQDWGIVWPEWFVDKYKEMVWIQDDRKGVLASKREYKAYGLFADFEEDIRKAIDWNDLHEGFEFIFVWLHESGRVNRVTVSKDKVTYEDAVEWFAIDGPTTY